MEGGMGRREGVMMKVIDGGEWEEWGRSDLLGIAGGVGRWRVRLGKGVKMKGRVGEGEGFKMEV